MLSAVYTVIVCHLNVNLETKHTSVFYAQDIRCTQVCIIEIQLQSTRWKRKQDGMEKKFMFINTN